MKHAALHWAFLVAFTMRAAAELGRIQWQSALIHPDDTVLELTANNDCG